MFLQKPLTSNQNYRCNIWYNSAWTNQTIVHVIKAMWFFSIDFFDFINTGP